MVRDSYISIFVHLLSARFSTFHDVSHAFHSSPMVLVCQSFTYDVLWYYCSYCSCGSSPLRTPSLAFKKGVPRRVHFSVVDTLCRLYQFETHQIRPDVSYELLCPTAVPSCICHLHCHLLNISFMICFLFLISFLSVVHSARRSMGGTLTNTKSAHVQYTLAKSIAVLHCTLCTFLSKVLPHTEAPYRVIVSATGMSILLLRSPGPPIFSSSKCYRKLSSH